MTKNEWGTLKKVVVGVADYAQIPPLDKSLRTVNYADVADPTTIKCGPYPQQVIDEANEDLETLSNYLRTCGVEVVRPSRAPQGTITIVHVTLLSHTKKNLLLLR